MSNSELLIILLCAVQLLFLAGIVVVIVLMVQNNKKGAGGQIELLKSEMENQRNQMKAELQKMAQELELTRKQVGESLQSVTGQVSSFGDIQKGIGEVREAAVRISKLGENISELQDILKSPKMRGGFGEILLDNLLEQVLPNDMYKTQYKFTDGMRVDAAVFLGDRILPIDAKFPLENSQAFLQENSESSSVNRRTFMNAVKKRIDETAKYIRADEKTYDFAMMYVPAEGVYYALVCDQEIFSYALQNHVIPVSPNSFYAYLHVVAFGLRGLQIEKNARIILDRLTRLSKDYQNVSKAYDTLGTHVTNAKNKYDEVKRDVDRFGDKLGSTSSELALPDSEVLGLPEK